jgi:hypothetical protein
MGHALAAVILGGRFYGFVLKWDGMGWASSSLPQDVSTTGNIIHLAAGVTATTLAGLLLLALAHVSRRRVIIRLCMLIISFACLMEGIPYILWNSYHPVPPGDIGRIMILWRTHGLPHAAAMRILLIVTSGIMFLGATFFLCALIFQGIEQALLSGARLSPRARCWMLLFFLAVPGSASWFLFDWNQLAPGIGLLPCIAGATSIIVSAILLRWFSLRPDPDIPGTIPGTSHLLSSWGALAVAIVLLPFWFQNGVTWG